MPSVRGRPWLPPLLFTLAFAAPVLVGALALGESGRLAQTPLTAKTVQEAQPLAYVYDSRTGWRLNPNTILHRAVEGKYDLRLQINKDGFIDREHALHSDFYRVAFLGDSWVEAQQVEPESRFSSLTEQFVYDISQGQQIVEVMNFGLSSVGTAHEYGIIKNFVLPYKPDEVWVFFFPRFDLEANSFIDNAPPMRPYYVYGDAQQSNLVDITFGYPKPPAVLRAEYARTSAEARSSYATFGAIWPYYLSRQSQPVFDAALNETRDAFGLIQRTLAAEGIRLRVVYLPNAECIDTSRWNSLVGDFRAAAPAAADVELDCANGERRFGQMMTDLGIESFSLTPALLPVGAAAYDDHFSLTGHRTVGEALARELLREAPLAPGSARR